MAQTLIKDVWEEAKDAKGHIASKNQNVYTKAQAPSATVGNATSNTLDVY